MFSRSQKKPGKTPPRPCFNSNACHFDLRGQWSACYTQFNPLFRNFRVILRRISHAEDQTNLAHALARFFFGTQNMQESKN
jgi:hypothetical protein